MGQIRSIIPDYRTFFRGFGFSYAQNGNGKGHQLQPKKHERALPVILERME